MQGINCIKGEIHNVLTVLRLNSQSGGSHNSGSVAQMEVEEQQLIRGLKDLYTHICVHTDLAHVDTLSYLTPFLTVITSKHTDIFTTAIALHSIHKFLVYGMIHADSPNVAAALTQLASSVTHCTFDVTDGEDAEVVSMKILEILLECLRCSAGEFLTDQAVTDMVTECFHVRSQQHTSKLLRRYAENVLMQMVLVLFARISPESSNASDLYHSRASSPSPSPMLPPSRSSSGVVGPGPSPSPSPFHPRSYSSASNSGSGSGGLRHRPLSVHSTIKDWNTSTELQMHRFNAAQAAGGDGGSGSGSGGGGGSANVPYGIPALHRIFRFLANLINPGDARNSEQDRILGLRLIRTVLETSSPRIGSFPPLIQVIQEELAKYLLQNSQTKNLFVLSLTLRIVFDLFVTVKQHLKVQLEVFFTSIHLRIGESHSSSFQQRELVLESLVEFCNEVSLIVGLYRNYDCELGCTDLFQDLCRFLANTAMQPWGGGGGSGGGGGGGGSVHTAPGGKTVVQPNHLNLLALEGMVAVLSAITKRFCTHYQTHSHAHAHSAGQLSHPPPGMRLSPALTPSHSSSSFPSSLTHGGGGMGGGVHAGNFIDESDDESTLLILSAEEEAHLLNKRANKQRLALAADQFNREGLTPQTVKLLQNLKILPPSVVAPPEADAQSANGSAGSSSSASASGTSTPTTSTASSSGVASPSSGSGPGAGSSGRKGAPFVPKSKHDPGVPPLSIVHFFRNTPGLDKRKIGEYLGDADPYNIRVLDAFVESFDFNTVPRTMSPRAKEPDADGALAAASDAGAAAAAAPQPADANAGAPAPAAPGADGTTTASKPSISLDDALRSFLDCFGLPGESQQIARIIERFSNAYFDRCSGPLKSADAAYVLCYSVIMLNTDAHNPQVTRKMSKDSYIRNLRGINEKEDLPYEYLSELYDSIVTNEIRINSDSIKDMAPANSEADANASWNRVLSKRSRTGAGSFHINAPRIHGREMFQLIWQQSIGIFIHYLENCCSHREGWLINLQLAGDTDPITLPSVGAAGGSLPLPLPLPLPAPPSSLHSGAVEHLKVLPKVVQGLSLFARVCAVYNLNDNMNTMLIALCKCVIAFLDELCVESLWDPKEIAIGFARDMRITHLLTLLFALLHEYGEAHVLEGWSNVVHVLLWLREMDLLPNTWLEMEDFRDSAGKPLESLRYNSNNTHLAARGPQAARRAGRERRTKEDGTTGGGGGIGSFFSWGGFFRGGANHSSNEQGGAGGGGSGGGGGGGGGGSGSRDQDSASAPTYTPTELYWLAKSKELIGLCNIPQLFEDSKYFRPATLAHLVRSLIVVSSAGTKSMGAISLASYSPHILHEESAVFCLERLADVIEKNQSRLNHPQNMQEQQQQQSSGSAAGAASPSASGAVAAPSSHGHGHGHGSIHLWSTIAQHFEMSIANVRNDPSCTFYIERLVVNLLRFSVRLVYSAETTSQLIALLALLLQLPKSTFAPLGQRIIAGTSLFLQTHGESIRSVREWEVVLSLLGCFKHHPLSAHAAFTTFVYVVDNHTNMDTFAPLLGHLTRYAQPADDEQAFMPVAPEAVLSLLLKLHSKLVTLAPPPEPVVAPSTPASLASQLHHESIHQRALLSPAQIKRRQMERERARTDLWLASLQNFCNIVRADPRPNVRKAALDALNNCLLAVGVSPPISPLGWKICFEKLLIPLLDGVQRFAAEPQAPSRAAPSTPSNSKECKVMGINMGSSKQQAQQQAQQSPGAASSRGDIACGAYDIRLKAATLVFQTFLHHMDVLCEMSDFNLFWLKFVGSMERYMQHSVALSLHFTEGLKNLLLVMHSSGVFATISERTGQNLLALTWTVIDSFRPELRQQLQEQIKATGAPVARQTKTNVVANGPVQQQQQQQQQQQSQPMQQQLQPPQPPQQQQQQPQQAQNQNATPLMRQSTPPAGAPPTGTNPASMAPPLPLHPSAPSSRAASPGPTSAPSSVPASPRMPAPAIDFSQLAPLDSSAPPAIAGLSISKPSGAGSAQLMRPQPTQFQPISPVQNHGQATHATHGQTAMHSPTPVAYAQQQQYQQQPRQQQPQPHQQSFVPPQQSHSQLYPQSHVHMHQYQPPSHLYQQQQSQQPQSWVPSPTSTPPLQQTHSQTGYPQQPQQQPQQQHQPHMQQQHQQQYQPQTQQQQTPYPHAQQQAQQRQFQPPPQQQAHPFPQAPQQQQSALQPQQSNQRQVANAAPPSGWMSTPFPSNFAVPPALPPTFPLPPPFPAAFAGPLPGPSSSHMPPPYSSNAAANGVGAAGPPSAAGSSQMRAPFPAMLPFHQHNSVNAPHNAPQNVPLPNGNSNGNYSVVPQFKQEALNRANGAPPSANGM